MSYINAMMLVTNGGHGFWDEKRARFLLDHNNDKKVIASRCSALRSNKMYLVNQKYLPLELAYLVLYHRFLVGAEERTPAPIPLNALELIHDNLDSRFTPTSLLLRPLPLPPQWSRGVAVIPGSNLRWRMESWWSFLYTEDEELLLATFLEAPLDTGSKFTADTMSGETSPCGTKSPNSPLSPAGTPASGASVAVIPVSTAGAPRASPCGGIQDPQHGPRGHSRDQQALLYIPEPVPAGQQRTVKRGRKRALAVALAPVAQLAGLGDLRRSAAVPVEGAREEDHTDAELGDFEDPLFPYLTEGTIFH